MTTRTALLRLAIAGLMAAGVLGACGGTQATDRPRTSVVTTSTVFADLIRNVGGPDVDVVSLVPAGADVHTYQAKPADLQAIAGADLVVMNGLGLDDWLAETIAAAAPDGVVTVRLADDLVEASSVELLPGEEAGTANPHLWMDVTYAALYVNEIAEALRRVDPGHAADVDARLTAYAQRLVDLDAWVRDQVAAVPAENRQIVTFHDAMPYFARSYGLTVVGVAVEAPGQDPSAGEIAALVDAIRESGVRAIFSEDQFPTALVDQLALATGASVVADLFDDSLGDDPVTSYEALIRWDVEHIVAALR